MEFGFIQVGGNAAQCLGHRLTGRIQAAAISTTTRLEFSVVEGKYEV